MIPGTLEKRQKGVRSEERRVELGCAPALCERQAGDESSLPTTHVDS